MNYSIRQRIIRNGRQDFLRPERKQIRFPHFAGFAERIRKEEKEKIAKYAAIETPKHLTE